MSMEIMEKADAAVVNVNAAIKEQSEEKKALLRWMEVVSSALCAHSDVCAAKAALDEYRKVVEK